MIMYGFCRMLVWYIIDNKKLYIVLLYYIYLNNIFYDITILSKLLVDLKHRCTFDFEIVQ